MLSWKMQLRSMKRGVVPCVLFFATTLLLLAPLLSPTRVDAGDYRYNSGDGTTAGTAVVIDGANPNESRNPFNSYTVRVTCESRLKVKSGNAAERNIFIPYDRNNSYKSFRTKFFRATISSGTAWIRPYFSGLSDTSFVTIISTDSTAVGWSTEAPIDSLRFWSNDDTDNWVQVYAR